MSEPLTDGTLVQRASRGDSIAFSELVSRHYRRALRIAFGLVNHVADAEDLVQEAFARVYARLDTFHGASGFYLWLYRIIVSLCVDSLRTRRRKHQVERQDHAQVIAAARREAIASGHLRVPDMELHRHQLSQRLYTAFVQLPESHRAILTLRELEGFSYREIADMLQIKKSVVMTRLFDARKIMQQSLDEEAIDQKVVPESFR